jgi:competence ComEA-like helix-hairpin-helix protein
MDLSLHEKIALIILSVLLLAGTFILHQRHSQPFSPVTINHDGFEQTMSLEEAVKVMEKRSKIDINTASEAELTAIPGVGKALAARIVEQRTSRGGFRDKTEILEVRGIGKVKFERMKERIRSE